VSSELTNLYLKDEKRFQENRSPDDLNNASQEQIIAKLMFSSHSLEKSLSHGNFEGKFGLSVAKILIERLEIYRKKGYDTSHLGYVNTISVLHALYNKCKDTKDKEELEEILADFLVEVKKTKSKIGGVNTMLYTNKDNNDKKSFAQLAEGRFSVREYANKPVDKKVVREALAIATKTPSACNRQSGRVYEIYNKEIITKVLEVQGGMNYYDTPPVLLLVTADDRSYVDINERNQGFIDGGMLAMSILYALEYKGFGACPLHAMFEEYRDQTIRAMLDIPEGEKLITFISVGHFRKNNNVCKSFRYPVEYITKEVLELKELRIGNSIESDEKEVSPEITPTSPVKIEIGGLEARIRLTLRPRERILRLKNRLKPRTIVRSVVNSVKNRISYDGAIVTLTGNLNYGNIIQRYALQEFLSKSGLRYRSLNLEFIDIQHENHQNTIAFIEKYIDRESFNSPSTKLYKTYIVGSDQVWRNWYNDNWDQFGVFWLNFVKSEKARRIAYAASFGNDTLEGAHIDSKTAKLIKGQLKKFDAISTREESGIKLAERLGYKGAVSAVDPTILLTGDDYSKLIDNSEIVNNKTAPIFSYVLDRTDDKLELIKEISKITKQEVGEINPHSGQVLPHVESWLKGFRDAELVITDSFHGLVFAMINNTDFVLVGNKHRGLARMTELLDKFNLRNRLVEEKDITRFDYKELASIDWDEVNQILNALRKESSDWLLSNVSKKAEDEEELIS